ncbi:MAG: hypothetical protein ABI639_17590 [Thermoanaerobaculia bacterium]
MAFVNLAEFNQGLDKFGKTVERQALLFQKKVAFMVLGAFLSTDAGIRQHVGLLQLTPVLTGRAVGNYIVSSGSPSTSTSDAGYSKSGSQAGNRKAAEMRVTVQALSALGSHRFGSSIWICNNLPYIAILNDGGTNRVAHHMLERALTNTRDALRSST